MNIGLAEQLLARFKEQKSLLMFLVLFLFHETVLQRILLSHTSCQMFISGSKSILVHVLPFIQAISQRSFFMPAAKNFKVINASRQCDMFDVTHTIFHCILN